MTEHNNARSLKNRLMSDEKQPTAALPRIDKQPFGSGCLLQLLLHKSTDMA
jgi:hypothetical protein